MIIDCNDLSTRKSDIRRGRKADVNITFEGRQIIMSLVRKDNSS